MTRESLAEGLKFHVLPLGPVHPEDQQLYNDVYAFWHKTWEKTFRELDNLEHLYADEFIRQGEKTCITFENQVIAYFANSWFDLNLLSDHNHSYFQPYPKATLEFLKQLGHGKMMTMGQLAVDPKFRKSEIGPFVTEVMLWQGYARFLESDSDALIAYTRNDRKINKLCYGYGSRCLREKLIGHNVEIDLIWTTKEDVKPHTDLFIRNVAARLWNNRTIYGGTTKVGTTEKLRKIA